LLRRIVPLVRHIPLRALWLSALLVLIVLVYTFFGSAGRRGEWPAYMAYYDLLAEGFRTGHLYLAEAPPPELLEQLDPFNPRHGRWWMWDVSLYDGHYYLYWGPLPALLQALVKSLLGIDRIIGDQYLVFGFFALATVFGGLLIEHMARRLFPTVSALSIALAVLAFGLANPVPHLVATAGVYQAAIAGGQAGLMGGLLLAFTALLAQSERQRRWRLGAAGSLWALALASRVSLVPAIGLVALLTLAVTAWPAPRATGEPRRDVRTSVRRGVLQALCLGAPLGLMVGLLLLYNQLRFDRWSEFGTGVQLTTMKFELSWLYWPVNAYSYALRAFTLSCEFPYVLQGVHQGASALPGWLPPPQGYFITEPLVGFLQAVPCLWLVPVAVWAGVRAARQLRATEVAEAGASGAPPLWALARARLWCVGSFAVAGSVSGVMVMGLYIATMRYLADVTYGLVLLAVFAAFTLESAARWRWQRWAAIALFALLASATVGAGLLLGYQGYNEHFQRFNPRLAQKLSQTLSLCRH
jgi:hypothetical protein